MKFYINVSAKNQSSIECLLKSVLKKNKMMLNEVSNSGRVSKQDLLSIREN